MSLDVTKDPISGSPQPIEGNQKPLVQVESVTGDALVSQKDGKMSIFLVVWIAFYHSMQETQNTAQIQQEASQQVSAIQQDLINQLSGMQFEQLPESEANTSHPNMGMITEINNNNQVVQAQINICQDKVGQVQQIIQVNTSEQATTIQSASQTMNENFSISQLMIELVKDISS